jgi:Protein of unknown function (DUF4197)
MYCMGFLKSCDYIYQNTKSIFMKRLFFASLIALSCSMVHAQGLKGLLSKTSKAVSESTGISKKSSTGLSNEEIIAGLKDALRVGSDKAAAKVSIADGFFKDAAIKILMPEEAKNAEQKLRAIGLGKQVDNAILSMNRAAEDAAKSAAPIFADAVKGMSFSDALAILRGSDDAATTYLKQKTSAALTEAFRPVIEQSLAKVNATKYWNTVFTTYNKFSADKVNPDLKAYVTEKALAGIFYQLALQEKDIRKNPAARTTEILKKVFAS